MSSLSQELSALGPLFQVLETLVPQTSAQATVQLVPANPMRWGLVIGAPIGPSAGGIIDPVISTDAGNITSGAGLGFGGTGASVQTKEFWFRRHGPLAQSIWFGGALNGTKPGSTVKWTVIEILLHPG